MEAYLNEKTRIKLKWHLPALDNVLALQRKKWYGWKTVSWIQPSLIEGATREYIRHWLEWSEAHKNNIRYKKKSGQRIMNKCGLNFRFLTDENRNIL